MIEFEILSFSAFVGSFFVSTLSFSLCYIVVVAVSYRQRWSTVCGKIKDIYLRCKMYKTLLENKDKEKALQTND